MDTRKDVKENEINYPKKRKKSRSNLKIMSKTNQGLPLKVAKDWNDFSFIFKKKRKTVRKKKTNFYSKT